MTPLSMTPFLSKIGSYTSDTGAEIVAYDEARQLIYVASGDTTLQAISISDPTAPTEALSVDIAQFGAQVAGANSIAYKDGLVAVALEAETVTDSGFVAVVNVDQALATGNIRDAIKVFTVGALPDMVTFTPDGDKVLVANEGEPDEGIDPNGSVSVIDVSGDFASLSQANVATADFLRFNGQEAELRADGVRIFPDAEAAQDFEPEYIAVSPDGKKAFVTLQENNAIAIVDVDSATVESVKPLGLKDYSLPGNGLDASDRDDSISIENEPVFGLYMPDSIAAFESGGETYYVIANEGDDRGDADEAGRGDAIRLKDLADVVSFGRDGLSLDSSFDEAVANGLLEDEQLGRLTISSVDGDTDGDGDLDKIVAYGGRSFSVLDADGNIIFDSGNQIAQITAELTPELFNANDGDPEEFDNRSDNKGAEPEAVTTGIVNGKPYAFVGLERAGGGVLVYDLSNPSQPEFVQYARSDEDIAPEGLAFITADESPNGESLLVVANEESNTIAIYEVDAPALAISEIQGAGHVSAFASQSVETEGIVTGVAFNGFYLQGEGDSDEATSDGIFVFTGDQPTVSVGDKAQVSATVSEFIPGGVDTGNLSITQLTSPEIVVLSSGNDLPEAVVIGTSGRVAPSEIVISDDELPVNLQTEAGTFDPAEDAIDFYESLEGMRVTVEDAVAVSPTRVFNRFSAEAFTLPNQGATATPDGVLNARGSINLVSGEDNTGDQNPERVQIQFDPNLLPDGFDSPELTVGDQLGDVTGVVGYSFGNFEVNVTDAFTVTPGGLQQEVTDLQGTDTELTIASYNVLNLSALEEDDGQRSRLATQIVNNLGTPDIIGLQEIQDNNGTEGGADDLETDATQTLQKLVDAIAAAGGPTYTFADVAPEPNSFGGAPGGNIRNAFLYNTDRVSLESVELLDGLEAFAGSRDPLVGEFTFNGETVTIVNNHFSSRFGSTPVFGGPQPFVQAGEDEREAQSQAVNDYVDSRLAENPDANVVVLGDLNTFQFTDDLSEILPGTGDEKILTNLVPQAEADDDAYSFIFDGNSQVLDHLFVTDGLLNGAEFDIVHVNNDFPRDDGGNQFTETLVASDHEPLVAKLNLEENSMDNTFQLQLLHLADQEAGIPALDDAPRASAVINALKDDYENTLLLSSGDAIIPGLFFSASEEAYGGAGRADILIQNELGVQAIALGNHEFDLGTGLVRDLVAGGADDPETPDVDESFVGTAFPYLSSNLDFSTSADLADLVVPDDQAPLPNSLAATTVIDVNGEQVGVVGATTPTLPVISSPGDVTVLPADFDGTPTDAQLDTLAAEIQQDVDELIAANPGLNKVVVLSHMQQISIEQALATRLTNVDVIVAGGSNTILTDEDDRLRTGDTSQGTYPIFSTDADGKPVAIVNTDGNYKYIGRLVVDFDENGNVIPESYDPTVSGAYATDEQGVADLNAQGLVDPEIQTIVDTLEEVIIAGESNLFGISDVYLDGRRSEVRTEETNLGNLTADANLAIAQESDNSVVISLKNGGGIRDDIGQVAVPPGGTGEPQFLPTEEIPGVKPAGGISETDIANTLRFNNGLTLLTITAEELLAVIEHGVAESAADDEVTPGRFPQVAGIEFSFDVTAPANDRVQSLVVLDEAGNDADVIVQDGELVGDATRSFRMVTLGFLAGGGDGYPFPMRDVVDLAQEDTATRTGDATFAPDGSEQDALAEYLLDNFGAETPFNDAETSRAEDTRIQNLAFREDTVIDGGDGSNGGNGTDLNEIVGTNKGEELTGTDGDDRIEGLNGRDIIAGGAGNDLILGGRGADVLRGDDNSRGAGGSVGGDDIIFGGRGNDRIGGKGGNDQLFGEEGRDTLYGDAGDDLLRGGKGRDTLYGDDNNSRGMDTFVLAVGEGRDSIMDFQDGLDVIGLADGLSFGQVTLRQRNDDVLIRAGGKNLAIVLGTDVDIFTAEDFVSV